MLKLGKQKGFTLVELAIVLVIVGLLIGGILKGQQLMENASITATVSQVKAIEAATTSFRDSYGELPGDLTDANSKISECEAGLLCIPTPGNVANNARFLTGDGIVGSDDWDMISYQPGNASNGDNINRQAGDTYPAVEAGFETILFWHHLEKSGLITAVKDGALYNTDLAFANSIPAAKITGGFWAGYSDGSRGITPVGLEYTLLGTIITLVVDPGEDIEALPNDLVPPGETDTGPLTPAVAAALDRKLDDGLPDTGSVQAYGYYDQNGSGTPATMEQGCTVNNATLPAIDELYNESNEKLDCGVHITIQQ